MILPLLFAIGFFSLLEARILLYSENALTLILLPFWAALTCAWAFKNASVTALSFIYGATTALIFYGFSFSPWWVAQVSVLTAAGLFFLYAWAARSQRYSYLVIFSFLSFLVLSFLVLAVQIASQPPMWVLLVLIGVISALLFFLAHTLVLELGFWLKFRLAWFSIVIGIIMAEFYWVLSRLPLDIVNIDFLLGIVYYTLWDISHRYLSLRFTKRALVGAIAVLVGGIAVVLISTRWLP